MKRKLAVLLLIVLCAGFSACGTGTQQDVDKNLNIVATVFPAYDFARQIAGERASVTLLLPPGAEAHSFEPTAQDLIRVRNASLFLCNGGESEAWVEEVLEGQDVPANVLCMLDCVEALEEEHKEGMQETHEQEHGEEETEEGPEYDEHVWTSPLNSVRICEAICETLCTIDPYGEESYRSNCAAYTAMLRELDEEFKHTVEIGNRRTVIFADRFPMRYFVEEYGLDYYAAFPGCAEDTEPSARTVAFLIDRVREQDIPAVFYIEFSNEKMADVICEDTGCKKLLFHSCHSVTADQLRQGIGYLDLMRNNADALKEALA